MKKILIEGWRGINHSYAMVNQYQLCEFAKMPDLQLYHRDLPFLNPGWSVVANNPGFPEPMTEVINGLAAPRNEHFDAVLRMASPYTVSKTPAFKVLTFITVEYGLGADYFPPNPLPMKRFTQGCNTLVTPSRWSKMKLVEYGFAEQKINVVPHGVSSEIFYPLTLDERNAVRRGLGLLPEHFIFLNLGAMTVNKGIDLLLLAFFEIRKRHPHARLVLKDDKKLYGIGVSEVVQVIMKQHPHLQAQEFKDAVIMLSVTLKLTDMRHLYGMANVYAAPYRAEGFNLPAMESIACGTPVIVTGGGATDDFCVPCTAKMISSKRMDVAANGLQGTGYVLNADLEELIQAMDDEITSPRAGTEAFDVGRLALCRDYSWANVAGKMASLF